MTWKRSTIVLISIAALLPLYKLVQACADGGDYEAESTFFANDITAKPAFRPFYYTDGPKYYDDSWYNSPESLPDPNTDEWKSYTANAATGADIDSFIYKTSYNELKSLYGNIEKGTPLAMRPQFAGNTFTSWFEKSKDFEALGYLMYAKQCEPYVTTENEWDHPAVDTGKMSRLAKNGQQLYAAAKNNFIKDKYAFQVIRLCLYANKPAQAIEQFDKLTGMRENGSYTYWRSLSLKAGALFRMKRKNEAAYLFSKVFDQSDYLRKSAFVSFDWCTGQDAAPVLPLCKTPHERAVVYVMDGLHEYDQALPDIIAAYSADPQVTGLDVLMTREINKVEQRYQRPGLYAERNVGSTYNSPESTAQAELQKQKQYLSQLNAFAQKAAAEKKTGSTAFWYLSASYLSFMDRNVADCKKMMELAKAAGMKPAEQDMYHTLQIIYAVRSSGTMTAQLEAQLLPDLKWLKEQHELMPFRYAMNTIITTAYLKADDTVKAIYSLGLGNAYNAPDFTDDAGGLLERMSIAKLQEVQAFAAKSNKTAYERWLTDSSIYTAALLYELEGTKYLRKHQFAKAIAPLEKSDKADMLPDPFTIGISEKMTWPEDDSTHLMSKLTFAKRMAALETKLAQTPDDPTLLIEYATGLYNMTYYGNAHHAYTYYRSTSDDNAYFNSPERTKLSEEEQEFYGAMKAEANFAKAAMKAKNKEQQAKALFMAAKCWQKRCPGKAYSYYEEEQLKIYYSNSLKNPYFLQLKAASANTAFYQEAIGTCGYLQDYAKH